MENTALLVDEKSIIKHGLTHVLHDLIRDIVIYEATSFEKAAEINAQIKPKLIILDIPQGFNIDLINILRIKNSNARILIFSNFDEAIYGIRYIKSGAHGYLSKQADIDQIKNAIKMVLQNEIYISEKLKDKYIRNILNETHPDPVESLSTRELEIAILMAKGASMGHIAKQLNLQLSTVSTYKHKIFEKLNITNIIDLAINLNALNIK